MQGRPFRGLLQNYRGQSSSPLFPSYLHLLIDLSDGCKLACVFRRFRRPQFTASVEIAAPEEVGGGDDRSAHGTVFIGALCPCQGIIEPEVETHEIQLTTGPIKSVTAAARASGEKGLLNVRQARNAVAKFCSGFEET